jgi:hypothetical protein
MFSVKLEPFGSPYQSGWHVDWTIIVMALSVVNLPKNSQSNTLPELFEKRCHWVYEACIGAEARMQTLRSRMDRLLRNTGGVSRQRPAEKRLEPLG